MRFYDFGPFRVDAAERVLLRDGRPVPLTPKAFDTLLVLVQSRGHLIERDVLMNKVWPESFVEEGNLKVTIFKLRKALGQSEDGEQYIETVPRRGYRFAAGIRESEEPANQLVLEKHTTSYVVIQEEEEQFESGRDIPQDTLTTALIPEKTQHQPRSKTKVLPVAVALGVVAVLLVYYLVVTKPATPANPTVRSLAVLPFKPLVQDSSNDYLGLGMADTLITRLSRLEKITVLPTSVIHKYTNVDRDPLDIGRELKVEAVLEGSLQQAGDRVRMNLRLVRINDGKPLWADKFDQPFSDIFKMQDAISERVAMALAIKLNGEEAKRLTKRYTENAQAYQLYLKGRYFLAKRNEEGLKKSLEFFQQAIDDDPDYALAYTGLADAYLQFPAYSPKTPTSETFPAAKAAVTKALALDEELAEAHTSLGFVIDRHEWNWSAAENEYRRAIELNPSYAIAHHRYGMHLTAMGRFDEALTELRLAHELDPLSLVIEMNIGMTLFFAHRYDEAIEELRKTFEIESNFTPAHEILGLVFDAEGANDEAIAEFIKTRTLAGDSPELIAKFKAAYKDSGLIGYYRKRLEVLIERGKQNYVSPVELARTYARLGEKEQAFKWLGVAYEDRHGELIGLKVEPSYANLYADPRFENLLRRLGLS